MTFIWIKVSLKKQKKCSIIINNKNISISIKTYLLKAKSNVKTYFFALSLKQKMLIKKLCREINFKKTIKVFQKPLFTFKCLSFILLGLFLWTASSSLRSLGEQESFPLLPTLSHGNYQEFIQKDSLPLTLVQGTSIRALSSSLVVPTRVLAALIQGDTDAIERGGVIEYVIKQGDTLLGIAGKFNISLDTLLWANNLTSATIRPGQKLIILPVSGVKHTVEDGDTLNNIAERYKVEKQEIVSFNNILGQEDIFIGQTLIIPDGVKPRIVLPTREIVQNIENLTPDQVRARFSTNNFNGQSHSFPFGQCTWWVAQKRAIPAWGHAKNWLSNAERHGFRTCRGRYCIPKVGAVIVITGCPTFGHVAYVEKVRGNKITFSEMNNIGWGRVNYQTITIGSHRIIAFIY